MFNFITSSREDRRGWRGEIRVGDICKPVRGNKRFQQPSGRRRTELRFFGSKNTKVFLLDE